MLHRAASCCRHAAARSSTRSPEPERRCWPSTAAAVDTTRAWRSPVRWHAAGVRVIAMSRFGYLRTPMPADASAAAQADAHVCLLDALGIRQAAVMGGSAGAPSALQMAIRHPDRVSALVLLVPLAYKPPRWPTRRRRCRPGSRSADAPDRLGLPVLGCAARGARPGDQGRAGHAARAARRRQPAGAGASQCDARPHPARVRRAAGLRDDTAAGQAPGPSPLESIRVPTLVISARDDRFGTYASAQYTASRIAGAKFIGFDQGGHTWVGHDDEVISEIGALLVRSVRP